MNDAQAIAIIAALLMPDREAVSVIDSVKRAKYIMKLSNAVVMSDEGFEDE